MTMLISDKEMAVFDKLARKRFIKELYQYYSTTFPEWAAAQGEENVMVSLESGLKNAKKIGLKERGSLYVHINLSLLLGEKYNEDIQYQQLMNDFNKNDYRIETERAKILYETFVKYMQQVTGEKDILLKDAILLLGEAEGVRLRETDFTSDMLTVLTYFYPMKVEFIERRNYEHFIEWGIERAKNTYAFEHPSQWAIYVFLMFFLGQYFDRDPFLAWLNWPARLEEIYENIFSFNTLAEKLKVVWKLEGREYA